MKNNFMKICIVILMIFACTITTNSIKVEASENYLYAEGENLTSYRFERLGGFGSQNVYKIKCIKPNGSYAKNEWINYRYKYCGKVCDNWIYFGSDGIDKEGWFQVNGKWYYGDETHDDDYIGIESECIIDGYYLDSNGTIASPGWHNTFDNYWVYCHKDGKAAKNTTIDGCYIDSTGFYFTK